MNLFFYWLLLQLIMNFIFKVDRSKVFCGIVAFCGKAALNDMQKLIVLTKIKILALFNQERGGDGCGMLINGQIYKGYEDWQATPKKNTKAFKDFFSDPEIQQLSYEKGVIIAHTRKGTMGGTGKENNHPFVVEPFSGDERLRITGVHNGSISNMMKLCTKHDVDYNAWKVDSHGLYMLMDKVGPEVLKEYEGHAALVWTLDGEPNSLFVYHGGYCDYKDEKIEDMVEERPMYFLETPEGIYLSSMATALDAIISKGEEVLCLEYNCIYQIKNGKFTKFKYPVDRLYGPNTKERIVSAATKWQERRQGVNGYYDSKGKWHFYNNHHEDVESELDYSNCMGNNCHIGSRSSTQGNIPFDTGVSIPGTSKIWREAFPKQSRDKERKVFFCKGRYWNPLTNAFAEGKMYLDRKGVIYEKDNMHASEYFFFKGIMLTGAIAYQDLNLAIKNRRIQTESLQSTINFAAEASLFSKYPMTNYFSESTLATNYLRFGFYLGGKRVNNKSFSPLFSSRNYIINKGGFLEDITTSEKKHDLPIFMESGDTVVTGKSGESVYDKIFTSLEEAKQAINEPQFFALKFFCFDYMVKGKKKNLDPDEFEVEDEVEGVILAAIAKNISIRKEIEDNNNQLEKYENRAQRISNIELKYWKKDSIKKMLGLEISTDSDLENKTPKIPEKRSVIQVFPVPLLPHLDNEPSIEEKLIDAAEMEIEEIEPRLEEPNTEEISRDLVETGLSEMIVVLGEINNSVDDLSKFISDDYAQELTGFMYKTLETIKYKIAALANENQDVENANLVNRTLNSKVA